MGSKVIIQDRVQGPSHLSWKEDGLVVEARQTKGGLPPQSFWVLTSEGRLKLRNRRFLHPFVMEEKDLEVLRADSVKVMTVFVAEAMRKLLISK